MSVTDIENYRPHVSIHCNETGNWHIFPAALVVNIASGKMHLDHLERAELEKIVRVFASALVNDQGLES